MKYPGDPVLRARVKSYELAFRMQTTVPEVFRFDEESVAPREGFTDWIRRTPGPLAITA